MNGTRAYWMGNRLRTDGGPPDKLVRLATAARSAGLTLALIVQSGADSIFVHPLF